MQGSEIKLRPVLKRRVASGSLTRRNTKPKGGRRVASGDYGPTRRRV